MFLLSLWLSCILLTLSFRAVFNFTKDYLSVLPFMHCAFVLNLRSHCKIKGHLDVPTFLFSGSFIILQFAFRSSVHLELIFLRMVKCMPIFFSHTYLTCSNTICWKDYPFLHLICPCSFVKYWLLLFEWVWLGALLFWWSICLFSCQNILYW